MIKQGNGTGSTSWKLDFCKQAGQARRLNDALNLSVLNIVGTEKDNTIDFRKSELVKQISEFVEKRAEHLFSNKSTSDVLKLDREFRDQLSAFRDFLRTQPDLVHELSLASIKQQNLSFFERLISQVVELGRSIGVAQGRTLQTDKLSCYQNELDSLTSRLLNFKVTDMQTHNLSPVTDKEQSIEHVVQAAFALGEHQGLERQRRAEEIAADINRNIGGWRRFVPLSILKNYHEVKDLLANISEQEIQLVKVAYQARTGDDLEQALVKAYGKKERYRIAALLTHDPVKQAAFNLLPILKARIFTGLSKRTEALLSFYQQLDIKQIQRLESILQRALNLPKGTKFASYIADRVSPTGLKRIAALRSGDLIKEQVLHVEELLQRGGRQTLQLRHLFGNMSSSDIQTFKSAYFQEIGVEVEDRLKKLPSSPAKDLCVALVSGDNKKIAAAKVACALQYRVDWIGKPFLNTNKSQRDFLIQSYAEEYAKGNEAAFWKDLKKAVWREDYYGLSVLPPVCRLLEHLWWPCANSYPFIESIVKNGSLSPAQMLRYFMVGVGVDVKGIRTVLQNRTAAEIAEIEQDYARSFPASLLTRAACYIPFLKNFILIGNLRHDLKVELSGDHEFDVGILMEGVPEGRDELEISCKIFSQLRRRYNYEHSGFMLGRFKHLVSVQGNGLNLRCFEQDYMQALRYFQEHIENHKTVSTEHAKRFCTLVKLAEVQAYAYRDSKVSLGSLVLNSGAFLGATAGAMGVLIFSAFSYPVVASAAFAGSLMWRVVQGRLILGESFGLSQLTSQFIRAAIDGASMFTVRLGLMTMGKFLGSQVSKGVTKGTFKTSLNRFVKKLEDSISFQNRAGNVLAGDHYNITERECRQAILSFREQLTKHYTIGINRVDKSSLILAGIFSDLIFDLEEDVQKSASQ